MRRMLLLLLCALLVRAEARIGENREALIKRFGKPLPGKIGDRSKIEFHVDGFHITCHWPERCSREDYRLISGEKLTEAQVTGMLREVWWEVEELTEAPNGARWWRKKGTFFPLARWSPDRKVLTFGSDEFSKDRESQGKTPGGL